jgi:hypothetical protein
MKKYKKTKILVGAQSWAYGPAGKASAIGHELKKQGALVDFVGVDTSFDFCKKTGSFINVFCVKSNKDYLKINFKNYDAVVSVMDPFLAFMGKKSNTPVFYADSMSRFWIWKNSKQVLKKFESLKRLDSNQGIKIIRRMMPDDRQLLGHLFSDRIFTQGTPQFIRETKNKVENVGSMIDLTFAKKCKKDTVLVSLSGGISPVTNLSTAVRYAKMIIDLISEEIKNFSSAKRFVLTGHPSVIEIIKRSRFDKKVLFNLVALNHEQFLKEINRAIVVLVPCGFTTIFESLASNTPLIFLPDNHNGHVYEYLIITEKIKNKRDSVFPNLLFTLSCSDLINIRKIDESMAMIRYFTNKYFDDTEFRKEYKEKFRKIVNDFNKKKNLVTMQKSAIRKFIPFFKGAKSVSEKILQTTKN